MKLSRSLHPIFIVKGWHWRLKLFCLKKANNKSYNQKKLFSLQLWQWDGPWDNFITHEQKSQKRGKAHFDCLAMFFCYRNVICSLINVLRCLKAIYKCLFYFEFFKHRFLKTNVNCQLFNSANAEKILRA